MNLNEFAQALLKVKASDYNVPKEILGSGSWSSGQVGRALSRYAKGCKGEDVLLLADTSGAFLPFNKFKEGIVVTKEALCSSELECGVNQTDKEIKEYGPVTAIPQPLYFADLDYVSLDDNDKYGKLLVITYKDGKKKQNAPGIYAKYIYELLLLGMRFSRDQKWGIEGNTEKKEAAFFVEGRSVLKDAVVIFGTVGSQPLKCGDTLCLGSHKFRIDRFEDLEAECFDSVEPDWMGNLYIEGEGANDLLIGDSLLMLEGK